MSQVYVPSKGEACVAEEEGEAEKDGGEDAFGAVELSLGFTTNEEYTVTWAHAFRCRDVVTIEDPLLETAVDKATYNDLYGKALDTLDGGDMASFFDFFFERQPSCPTHWVFKGEEEREDFRDCCRELGCLPSMKEAQEGEDEVHKTARKIREAEDARRDAYTSDGDEDDDLFDRSGGVVSEFADGKDEATLAAEDEAFDAAEAAAAGACLPTTSSPTSVTCIVTVTVTVRLCFYVPRFCCLMQPSSTNVCGTWRRNVKGLVTRRRHLRVWLLQNVNRQ